MINAFKIVVRKLQRKGPLGTQRHKLKENIEMGVTGSGQGPVAGSCEHHNESLGRIFLDLLSDYIFLKKGPAPWSWVINVGKEYKRKRTQSIVI
jgi:hypothetical protein